MRLTSVVIKNFRSIEEMEISFISTLKILVGKNEAGKSNILRALSLLDDNELFTLDDIKLPIDEKYPTESYIDFNFSLENHDIELLFNKVSKCVYPNYDDEIILIKEGKNYDLMDICKYFNKFIWRVDLINDKRSLYYWSLNKQFLITENWKKTNVSSVKRQFGIEGNAIFDITKMENSKGFIEFDLAYINTLFYNKLVDLFFEQRPSVTLWQYNEANMLPIKVNTEHFLNDTSICIPLRSMFNLAGIDDIKATVENALKTSVGFRNLLKKVGEVTTRHFISIWKEYDSTEFELLPDGEYISIAIKDTYNSFDFSKRSDGFKRFVSFLLFILARDKTNYLNNSLVIIDEPDSNMHPSGQKFFRDELIKIAKNNYLIYSTHSIFMIDKQNPSNNYIVEKKNEITSLQEVNVSNIFDEEVICNALGYSVFETLKEFNIIFEGWKDKKLFIVGCEKLPTTEKKIKAIFDRVGICHAKGVKHVKSVASILELANREYLIISDSDKPAKEKQKEYEKLKMMGIWKTYNELIEGYFVTSEDFIKPEFFLETCKHLIKKYPFFDQLVIDDLIKYVDEGILFNLNNFINLSEKDKDRRQEIINNIKDYVFENLKPGDIKDDYITFLSNLSSQVENNNVKQLKPKKARKKAN